MSACQSSSIALLNITAKLGVNARYFEMRMLLMIRLRWDDSEQLTRIYLREVHNAKAHDTELNPVTSQPLPSP
jgi:hypothetical protein